MYCIKSRRYSVAYVCCSFIFIVKISFQDHFFIFVEIHVSVYLLYKTLRTSCYRDLKTGKFNFKHVAISISYLIWWDFLAYGKTLRQNINVLFVVCIGIFSVSIYELYLSFQFFSINAVNSILKTTAKTHSKFMERRELEVQ